MGNFYANVTLLAAETEAVVRTLSSLRRQVLRAPSGEGGYVFEHERHAELVRLLGLPDIAVATGYQYIEAGEMPDGLEVADLRRVG